MVPGGGAMHLNDGLYNCKNIKHIAHHNEQACTIAAEAYYRASGKIGVALVTTGPGGTNAITGVAGAWIESTPMLVISGQVKKSDLINKRKIRQNGPQEVPIVNLVKSITKYSVTIKNPNDILYELQKAINIAESGRKGPVWLDIPLDIQACRVNTKKLKSFSPKKDRKGKVCSKFLEQIINKLQYSKRPVLLIGHGVRLAGGELELKKLIQKLKIPVLFTWNAMDMLDFNSKYNMARPGSVALRFSNFTVQNSDLLITIGARLDKIVTAFNLKNFAPFAEKYITDIDPYELKKFDKKNTKTLEVDAKTFLLELNEFIKNIKIKSFYNWIYRCNLWKTKYPLNDGKPFNKTGKIKHLHLIDRLSQYIPENSLIVTGSSGLAIESFYLGFRNKKNQRIFLTSGLGAMGYGIPALIGAAAISKNKNIIGIESDGSLMMNLQELATLKTITKNIKLVILNNFGYSSIKNTQKNYFNSRFIAVDKNSGLEIPNLTSIFISFGYKVTEIKKINEIDLKLDNFFNNKKLDVCIVSLDPDDYLWPKVAAIPQPDGKIISMPLEDMSPLLSRKLLQEEMIVNLHESSMLIKDD